jgi:cytochrome c oxidase cbb3-type subunit III
MGPEERTPTREALATRRQSALDPVTMSPRIGSYGRRFLFCNRLVVFAAVLAMLSACKREQRQFEPGPSQAQTNQVTQSELRPGAQTTTDVKNDFEERAYDVNEGKRIFTAYNCSGCHANGGGGIGPALMDEKWIYGSEPINIYSTIVEGRPNGMPSFRNKVPDAQVWQLASYVRSLSGQLRKDVSPSRSDNMNPHKSEQASEKKAPQKSTQP